MKRKFLLSFLMAIVGIVYSSMSFAQTQLNAGDVAIVSLGPSTTDQFTIVLLADIASGTVIDFTDNGFNTTTTGYTNEGFITYTAPAAQCAGTVITWTLGSSANSSGWSSPTGNFKLNASGEQLFVFQGTGTLANLNFGNQAEGTGDTEWGTQTNIKVLYGMQTDASWITTGSAAAATSYLPATSVLASAYVIQVSTSKSDVAYKNTTTSGTPAVIVASLTTTGNFNTSTSQLSLPAYTAFTVTLPAPSAPTSNGDVTVTYDGLTHSVSTTITAPEVTVDWYDASTNGNLLSSGSLTSLTKIAAGTYTFYAQARSNCRSTSISSTRTKIVLTINPAPLTITANNQNKTYGTTQTTPATGSTAFGSSGLKNGETIGSVTLTYSSPGGLAATATVGTTSTITPSAATGGTFNALNYTITYTSVSGTLTVVAAVLTVTADNKSVTYGDAVPTLTYTITGFVNSENTSVVTGVPTLSTSYTATTPAASSPVAIAIAKNTLTASNYTFTVVPGTITIAKAALTITANNQNKTYGTAQATPVTGSTAFGSSGLKNGETIGSVTLTYSSPGGLAATAAVGTTSTITPSAATGGTFNAANYTISYTSASGTLTVIGAVLTVTADNKSVNYGDAVPTLTYTITGFVNGQNTSVVTGVPALSTSYTSSTSVASSPVAISITANTLAASNYTFTFVSGTITIAKAAITITASNQNKPYGTTQATPVTGSTAFNASGLKNSETIGSVTLTYSSPGGLAATAAVGTTSTITPSAATGGTFNAVNYTISYTSASGTLTVIGAVLTVTADNKSVNYGDAVPTLTYTITGFVNGQNISVVTGAPLLSTSYTSSTFPSASPVAISITANTLAATNYTFTVVPGIISINAQNIWTGGTSTDWNTTSNWDSRVVPASSDNVIIASNCTYYPMLTTNVTTDSINLQTGSTLSIGTTIFSVNGAISGSGTITGSSTSSLTLNGTAGTLNFTHTADTLLNLTVGTNASATLGSTLDIAAGSNTAPGQLSVGSGAVFNTANGLTLCSNNTSTAIVAAIPENATTGAALGTINGSVNIERYIHSNINPQNPAQQNGSGNTILNDGLRAWRLLTAPITKLGSESIKAAWQNNGIRYSATDSSTQGLGVVITGPSATNGLDTVSGVSLYSWNNSTQAFTAMSSTLGAISNGNYGGSNGGNTGYMLFVRGDRNLTEVSNPNAGGININNTTLIPSGTLITGRQVYNVQHSTGLGVGQNKFTVIANPYAAPVDLMALDTTNIRPQYYIWNPNLNTVGGFVTIDFSLGTPVYVPTTAITYVNQYVQSSEAFMAIGGTGSTDGTITFNESAKQDSNNNYVFRPAMPTASLYSNLYLFTNGAPTLADGNLVQFGNGYNSGIDYYDALKVGNNTESFGLLRNGLKLSIERRPVITSADTIYLNLASTTKRSYQFQFTANSLYQPGLVSLLKDSYLGTSTPISLSGTTAVNFAVDNNTASQSATRFMIVFQNAGGTPLPVTFTGIKATEKTANTVAVSWTVSNEVDINSYEVEKSTDGITYTSIGTVAATGANQYSFDDTKAGSGTIYYRVESIGSNGVTGYSQIAQVIIATENQAITIYPNPIQNNTIELQFTNMPEGVYTTKVLATTGQVLKTTTINHPGGNSSQAILLGNTLAKGVYELEIIDANNSIKTYKVDNQ